MEKFGKNSEKNLNILKNSSLILTYFSWFLPNFNCVN